MDLLATATCNGDTTMKTATKMTSLNDLRTWVDSHLDQSRAAELNEIIGMVQRDPSRPAWGGDWSEYLEQLGGVLFLND
jgi:hypothetical protein